MSAESTASLRYSPDHCWARAEPNGGVTIGLTEFAQGALGAVVFVELPAPGTLCEADAAIAEVESTKAVSEIYAPVPGEITAVNDALTADPGKINTDPYGAGWVCTIAPSDPGALGRLLDAWEYSELTESGVRSQPSTKD